MFPKIGTSESFERLIFSIDAFGHAPEQQTASITRQEVIPIASPKALDDLPASAEIVGFEFLNDLAVPPNWTVKALKVAVDDKNQIVQSFAGCNGEGTTRLRLVLFSIAEKRPYLAV
jgi:hypothetical protein